MINKLAKKALAVLGVGMLIVVIETTAAALDVFWPAVAGLGLLQLGILGLLLEQHKRPGGTAAPSAKGLDALSTRLIAAVETERLDAIDRHRELLDALKGGVKTST